MFKNIKKKKKRNIFVDLFIQWSAGFQKSGFTLLHSYFYYLAVACKSGLQGKQGNLSHSGQTFDRSKL